MISTIIWKVGGNGTGKNDKNYSNLLYFIIKIGPGARSDSSKTHVLSEYKT